MLPQRVVRWLERESVARWATLVTALLGAPTLWAGYQTEDWGLRWVARSKPLWENPFTFRNPDIWLHNHQSVVSGALPWITSHNFALAFWRPLSAWLERLDERIAPHSALFAHAHSLLWLVGLTWLAGVTYRRLSSSAWIAGLATVMYACDDMHGLVAGWLSQRNALVSATGALVALWAFDRARRDGWRWGYPLTTTAVGLALSGGESALLGVAQLAAYGLCFDTGRWQARTRGALAWLVPTALWAAYYSASGHGAFDTGLYTDPIRQPGSFLAHLPLRWGAGWLGLLVGPTSELWLFAGAALVRIVGTGVILAAAALVAALGARVARDNRSARFYLVATALSLVGMCTGITADRLMTVPSLTALGFLAELLAAVTEGRATPVLPLRIWAGVTVVLNLILAPLAFPMRSRTYRFADDAVVRAGSGLADLPDGTEAVLVNGVDFYFGALLHDHLPESTRIARTWLLYGGPEPLQVTRTDDCALRLDTRRGMLAPPINRVYRAPGHLFRVGEGLQLKDAQIIIAAVNAKGDATSITFRSCPLERPGRAWRSMVDGKYVPFALPDVGQSVVLPGTGPRILSRVAEL